MTNEPKYSIQVFEDQAIIKGFLSSDVLAMIIKLCLEEGFVYLKCNKDGKGFKLIKKMTLPTQLYHYSKDPIEKLNPDFHLKNHEYMPEMGKPFAFWFSVEDYEDDQTWLTWCISEKFRLKGLKHRHKVILKSNANILFLNTSEGIRDFGFKYQKNDQCHFDNFIRKQGRKPYPYVYQIKWNEFAKECDGIVIAPYQWECSLKSETTWYYGWDCSSGCIWNYDAIDRIEYDMAYVAPDETLVETI